MADETGLWYSLLHNCSRLRSDVLKEHKLCKTVKNNKAEAGNDKIDLTTNKILHPFWSKWNVGGEAQDYEEERDREKWRDPCDEGETEK